MIQLTNRCFRKIFILMVMVASSSVGSIAQTSKSIPREMEGTWVIKSYYMTPNVWIISLKQAQSLVGSNLIYEDGTLTACNQHVVINKVERGDVSAAEFLARRNNVHFRDVGINGEIAHEITINGRSGGNCFGTYELPGEDVYVKSRNELLLDFEGVYFRAIRVMPKKCKK